MHDILTIGVLMLILMLPATSLSLTFRLQADPQLRNHREMTMKVNDLKRTVVTAVVGSILGISSSITPSFAESAASKDVVSISGVNKVNRPVMSKQTSESVLSDRVDKTENDIIKIKGNIKKIESDVIEIKGNIKKIDSNIADLRRDGTVVFCVASILFVIRSEFNDDQMKKVMDNNKAEADEKMAEIDAKIDKNKAEADAKMDRNFIITNSISATSLLISLMTLVAKK